MFTTPRSTSAKSWSVATKYYTLLLLVCLGAVLGIPPYTALAANVVYVVPGGAGTRSGTSWDNAKDLQDALTSTISGELWVKGGTYTPTNGTDRNATFLLKDDVSIYGGFNGTETQLAERDYIAHPTYLSGSIGDKSNFYDNSSHVVTSSNPNTIAVLDGVRVTFGASGTHGGGIFNMAGTIYIRNSTILKNDAADAGGGIYNAGTMYVTNTGITDNWSSDGGGIHNTGHVSIFNSSISNNFAGLGKGGGLSNSGTIDIINSSINQNETIYQYYGDSDFPGEGDYLACGTASAFYNYGTMTLTNTIIRFNYSSCGDIISNAGALTSINVTITDNQTESFWGGDGQEAVIFSYAPGTFVMRNSIVWEGPSDLDIGGSTAVDIQYSDIRGGFVGTGNIDVDPLFEDESVRLKPTSPMIDHGSNAALPAGITTDFSGNPRIAGGSVDIGAYERQTPCASPPVLYVDQAVNGGFRDGSSWANAFPSLKEALNNTTVCSGIKQIWVARGTYTPTITSYNTYATFALKNGLAIYGGFNGTE